MSEVQQRKKRDVNSKIYRDIISMNQERIVQDNILNPTTVADDSFKSPAKVPSLNLPNQGSSMRDSKEKLLLSFRDKSNTSTPAQQLPSRTGGSSSPEIPPFVFRRIPRLEQPLVNVEALRVELESTKASPMEGWLDSVFNTSEHIYEDVIRKLRQQVLILENRMNLLESNLDTAEIEIEYWRDVYSNRLDKVGTRLIPPKSTASDSNRHVTRKCWQLAVSKFVGSDEQFITMRALFHWKEYTLKKKAFGSSTTHSARM